MSSGQCRTGARGKGEHEGGARGRGAGKGERQGGGSARGPCSPRLQSATPPNLPSGSSRAGANQVSSEDPRPFILLGGSFSHPQLSNGSDSDQGRSVPPSLAVQIPAHPSGHGLPAAGERRTTPRFCPTELRLPGKLVVSPPPLGR